MTAVARGSSLHGRLVPDELWALVAPLTTAAKPRPQGGGRQRVDDRAVFTAVVYVLTSGCAWRHVPRHFAVAAPTAYRRYVEWTQSGLFASLSALARDRITDPDLLDWVAAIVDNAAARAESA